MPFSILVVDDSAVARAMIVRIIKLTGLPVADAYEATNGQQGMQLLGERKVDLALVNINMPVMSGDEMIERMRSHPTTAQLPIIVISAERDKERYERLRKNSVEFVHKPFTPEALRKTIIQLMGVSNEQLSGENPLSESGPDF